MKDNLVLAGLNCLSLAAAFRRGIKDAPQEAEERKRKARFYIRFASNFPGPYIP